MYVLLIFFIYTKNQLIVNLFLCLNSLFTLESLFTRIVNTNSARACNDLILFFCFVFQGQAVAQLAKTIPDITIFGVCSKSKHEALKAANSPIDHLLERGSDYTAEVRKVLNDGVDIVLDCLCGEECNKGYSILKPMGRYILYGSSNVVTGETKSFFSAARSVNKNLFSFNLLE